MKGKKRPTNRSSSFSLLCYKQDLQVKVKVPARTEKKAHAKETGKGRANLRLWQGKDSLDHPYKKAKSKYAVTPFSVEMSGSYSLATEYQ